IRFTQGDLTALPAAARELVQYGVDLIFASQLFSAKAAQVVTTRIPIVFAGGQALAILWRWDWCRASPGVGGISQGSPISTSSSAPSASKSSGRSYRVYGVSCTFMT